MSWWPRIQSGPVTDWCIVKLYITKICWTCHVPHPAVWLSNIWLIQGFRQISHRHSCDIIKPVWPWGSKTNGITPLQDRRPFFYINDKLDFVIVKWFKCPHGGVHVLTFTDVVPHAVASTCGIFLIYSFTRHFDGFSFEIHTTIIWFFMRCRYMSNHYMHNVDICI